MALKWLASLILTLLAATGAGAKTPPAKAAKAPARVEWVIVQDSVGLGGDIIYVTSDAVRMTAPKDDLEVLTKAPSWKVYCFRRRERIMYVSQTLDWDQLFAGIQKSGKVGSFEKIGPAEYQGMRCTRFVEPQYKAITLTADDIKTDSRAADMISDYFHIPKFGTVPLYNGGWQKQARKYTTKGWLKMDNIDISSDRTYKVLTKSCKKIPYNPADFEVPSGYKLCAKASDIMFSPGKKKQIESFLEDLGFAQSTDEAKKKAKP